jgi:hypothetical protein
MTDSGWRKRQIALDKKAENARELGLDYEPSIMEMARKAGIYLASDPNWRMPVIHDSYLETFAELVRKDEREAMLRLSVLHGAPWHFREAIRARGQQA